MNTKPLPLTEEDKIAIRKALKRGAKEEKIKDKWLAGLRMNYNLDENFTAVAILDGKALYIGASKRNPIDKYDARIGLNIAIKRAILSSPIQI